MEDFATHEGHYFHAKTVDTDLPNIMSDITQKIRDYKAIDFTAEVFDSLTIIDITTSSGIVTHSSSTINWEDGIDYTGDTTINLTLEHTGTKTGSLRVFQNASLHWLENETNFSKSIADFQVTVYEQLQINTAALVNGMID